MSHDAALTRSGRLVGRPRALAVRHEGSSAPRPASLREDRRVIAEVAAGLATSLDLGSILIEVMRLVHGRLGYGNAAVFLLDPSRRWLQLRAAYGDMVDPVGHATYRQRVDHGLIGRAFQTGRIVRVDDVLAEPGYLDVLPEARSELCVPLVVRGEAVGVLDVQLRQANAFGEREVALLGEIASRLAAVIQNAALYDEAQRRTAELEAVAELARAISAALDTEAVLDEVLRQIAGIMPLEAAHVALQAPDIEAGRVGGLKVVRAYRGGAPAPAEAGRPFGDPPPAAARAIALREPTLAADDDRSQLFAPLVSGDEVLGLLWVESEEADAYDAWDARLLGTVARQAAVALANARLFEVAGEVQALRALSNMKDELIATISHELRTPLASIFGFAEMLAEQYGHPGAPVLSAGQQQLAVRRIHAAADHMCRVIDDVLDLTRLSDDRLVLRAEPVELVAALSGARDLIQSTLQPGQRVVVLTGAAPAVALADPGRLRQVLINLLRNASLYSAPGATITLGGDVRDRAAYIWVRDEGVGMTPEQCERAFARFWRGPVEVTSGRPGAGLGLAICRGLVEAMSGRIWADSPGLGRGSTLHVLLPLAPAIG